MADQSSIDAAVNEAAHQLEERGFSSSPYSIAKEAIEAAVEAGHLIPADRLGGLVDAEGNIGHHPGCVHAPGRCPLCNSPSPGLHPAMQCGGEVELCRHPYHQTPERL